MDLKYDQNKVIIKDKVLTSLDRFVLDFTGLLEEHVNYVVVSGYVVILFGRARGTEDIDIIIRRMDKEDFATLYHELREEGYYFLNPENENGLYEMLDEGLRIRTAKENTIIPNIELKFIKDDFDRYSIDNQLEVFIDQKHLNISPIEIQIPYKLYLGSDKDIEDAIYLWEIFKDKMDISNLRKFMKSLKVSGGRYGIEV